MPTNAELKAMCEQAFPDYKCGHPDCPCTGWRLHNDADTRSKALALAIAVRDKTGSKWISVSDAPLPEDELVFMVLEYLRNGKMINEVFLGLKNSEDHGELMTPDGDYEGWSTDEVVTHWMPIPKLPELRSLLSESGKPEVKK